ncbi:hypothetical protein [Hoeflea sp.]|uniref:hypothetical protein n=1 Tax=Hoeflea sp. TaxID=1940281 RepID=UPI0019A84C8D|nr:hypothetical protein [Hoeflea sp.]MBC7282577.1 hypothetical protein [Hoeflea sp.]
MTLSRKPLQIVEIDLPRCTRTYATAPCTAALGTTGDHKCYNSIATCQDVPNFLSANLTLRFSKNQSGLPRGQAIYPALSNVTTRAGRVNLSGIDPKRSPLGQRARITVTLQDFTDAEAYIDKYQAERISGAAQSSGIGYRPKDRGTFFAKLKKRWPYYLGKPLRVLEGYEGDALASMRTRSYVITEWSGPNAAGKVTITAKDVLDLADNNKAQAPVASRGKLLADISASATTLTLTPSGIGSEYSASGYVAIGREVMAFTRSSDTLTVTRAQFDTTASAHSTSDVVQECLIYTKQRADVIIADLLTTYAGIDPAFIDTAAWFAESERWLGGIVFGAIITKPEGVAGLIGEICQHGIMVWWDEVAQEIRFKLNRPLDLDEVFLQVTDDRNIIEGTADIEDAVDERASQVHFWHGIIDPTGSVTDGSNFKKLVIGSDLTLEGDDFYGESRIKEIFSRWFGTSGDDATASVIVDRLIARYKFVPENFTCDLDAKDLSGVGMTSLVEVSTRLLTDDTGIIEPRQMQVLFREETQPGSRFRIEAQTFPQSARFGYIMADSSNDYSSATASEISRGCYIANESTLVFSDGTGPYLIF